MTLDLKFYWKLFLRRFPVMALFILICSGLGVITALKTPETYRTAARLLVEAPQIPDRLVATTVTTSAIEQLDIIEQRLMTRANMIDLANRFDVFEDMSQMDPDEVVQKMRGQTRIRRVTGRNQATLMTVSFTARRAKIAAEVVNQYVTLILEANSDFRTSRAENTLRFFEQEVERLGQELDLKSVAIASFKSENATALPEDQSYRLSRLTLLQERLARYERDLSQGYAQRDDIVRIFESTGRLSAVSASQITQSAEERALTVARVDLDQLLVTYSAENPRVQRQQREVDRLEAIVAAQANVIRESEEGAPPISAEQLVYEATLSDINARLEALETDITTTQAEIEQLEQSVNASAANGIELDSLERDRDIVQRNYDAALGNLNTARMSERVESTAQGQRITEIESASIPNQPTGPNRLKIIGIGVGAGLGLAAAYFALLEVLNRTVRRPAELVSRFNVTPLVAVPYMESRKRRLLRRGGLVLATLLVLAGVPAGLWYVDTNYLPLEIVVQKTLDQLGLG